MQLAVVVITGWYQCCIMVELECWIVALLVSSKAGNITLDVRPPATPARRMGHTDYCQIIVRIIVHTCLSELYD